MDFKSFFAEPIPKLKIAAKVFIGVALLIMIGVGVLFAHHWIGERFFPKPQPLPPQISISTDGKPSEPGEPQVVYVQGNNTHTKEVVYVPKEIDKATGEKEKTDVQFDRKQGKVYVKVNGKEFEVPADVKESAKFENGKLVITEQTEMRVNITAPKPAFNIGLGWSVNGAAAQANGPLYKNVSWWVYGDRETVAGGVQFPIMK